MPSNNKFPWNQINDYLVELGKVDSIEQFSKEALRGLSKFIPFDEGAAYLLDGNGKMRHQELLNFDGRHSKVYWEYYSQLKSISKYIMHERKISPPPSIQIWDWGKEPRHEFISDFIRLRGLTYSLDIMLYDHKKIPHLAFCLDRKGNAPFTEAQIEIVQMLCPHFENIIRLLSSGSNAKKSLDRREALMEMAGLTAREKEIAFQLSIGTSPSNISKRLRIAPTTTYKHIARIYDKMNVSNIQEFLVYLFNPDANFR